MYYSSVARMYKTSLQARLALSRVLIPRALNETFFNIILQYCSKYTKKTFKNVKIKIKWRFHETVFWALLSAKWDIIVSKTFKSYIFLDIFFGIFVYFETVFLNESFSIFSLMYEKFAHMWDWNEAGPYICTYKKYTSWKK